MQKTIIMQQTKSPADKSLQTIGVFFLISMPLVMFKPERFSWITAVFGITIFYIALQKLKFDKKAGKDTSKAKFFIAGGAISACMGIAVTLANYYYV